jgi:hypothetical protein
MSTAFAYWVIVCAHVNFLSYSENESNHLYLEHPTYISNNHCEHPDEWTSENVDRFDGKFGDENLMNPEPNPPSKEYVESLFKERQNINSEPSPKPSQTPDPSSEPVGENRCSWDIVKIGPELYKLVTTCH